MDHLFELNYAIKPYAFNSSITSAARMPTSIANDGPIPKPVAPDNPDKT
jgi:hypothetical protein